MPLANKIIRKLNLWLHLSYYVVISLTETVYLRIIGVKIGSGSKMFRGWMSCFLADNSTILIGDNCSFNSNGYQNHIGLNHRCILTTMNAGAQLVLGKNVGVSSSSITSFKSVVIGDNVRIGANCVITDGDFHLDDPRVGEPRPIVIEDNVWLGYGVIVMKGVRIGRNSIIGMNSVVTKDVPPNCIAAGTPCHYIKDL